MPRPPRHRWQHASEEPKPQKIERAWRSLGDGATAVLASARRAAGVPGLVALLQIAGCGFDCDDVPVRAASMKEAASRCGAGDTCVVFTEGTNCTGALACPFPVNQTREAAVADEVREFAAEVEDCDNCGQPFCAAGGNVVCDTRVGSCVFVP